MGVSVSLRDLYLELNKNITHRKGIRKYNIRIKSRCANDGVHFSNHATVVLETCFGDMPDAFWDKGQFVLD